MTEPVIVPVPVSLVASGASRFAGGSPGLGTLGPPVCPSAPFAPWRIQRLTRSRSAWVDGRGSRRHPGSDRRNVRDGRVATHLQVEEAASGIACDDTVEIRVLERLHTDEVVVGLPLLQVERRIHARMAAGAAVLLEDRLHLLVRDGRPEVLRRGGTSTRRRPPLPSTQSATLHRNQPRGARQAPRRRAARGAQDDASLE